MPTAPTTPFSQLKLQLLHHDETTRLEIDPAAKFIYLQWLKHPDSTAFRDNFLRAIQASIDHDCQFWLSDARAIHYLELADQNWVMREIVPMLPQINLQKFARLSKMESISLMDIPQVFDKLGQLPDFKSKHKLEIFATKEDALHWLFEGKN